MYPYGPEYLLSLLLNIGGAGLLAMTLPQICPCSAGLFAVLCKLNKIIPAIPRPR